MVSELIDYYYEIVFEKVSNNINTIFSKPILGMYLYLAISSFLTIYKNFEIIKHILFQIYLIVEIFVFIISVLLLLVWIHFHIYGNNNLIEENILIYYFPNLIPTHRNNNNRILNYLKEISKKKTSNIQSGDLND